MSRWDGQGQVREKDHFLPSQCAETPAPKGEGMTEDDLCECGERIEDECLPSCACARCEAYDLEAELDRMEYFAEEYRGERW
jgi:hypothetical protein|tara:strand:+ start:198 stop:443 length:246 start_codon:yes stop_codon:yes gene_type:complete